MTQPAPPHPAQSETPEHCPGCGSGTPGTRCEHCGWMFADDPSWQSLPPHPAQSDATGSGVLAEPLVAQLEGASGHAREMSPTALDGLLSNAASRIRALHTELAETHAALCLMGSTANDTEGRPYIGSERWKRNKAALRAARGEAANG